MRPFSFIGLLFGTAAAESWHHASGANCRQGIDVVFLQDTTQTFEQDLKIVTSQAFDIFDSINDLFPHSRFGVAEFKDKPFIPLGYPDFDYCYRLAGPLADDSNSFRSAYSELYASAGGDLPEDSYQALINVALDANVGWRPFASSPAIDPTKSAARIVVLLTDASPHMAGDMAKYPNDVPQLPANPGTIWQDRFDEFCSSYDYPSYTQVADALASTQTSVIFLIKPDSRDKGALGAWKWVNRDVLKQPDWFVHQLSDNSADLASVVTDIMNRISTVSCEDTTTTPEPSTTTTLPTTTRTTSTPMIDFTRTTAAPGVAKSTTTAVPATARTLTTVAPGAAKTITTVAPGAAKTTTTAAPGAAKTITTVAPGAAKTTTTAAPGAAKTTTTAAPGAAKTTTTAAPGAAKTITTVAPGAAKTTTTVAPGAAKTTTTAAPGAAKTTTTAAPEAAKTTSAGEVEGISQVMGSEADGSECVPTPNCVPGATGCCNMEVENHIIVNVPKGSGRVEIQVPAH